MSKSQDIPTKLAKAQQQLHKARARVADLEAQLYAGIPDHAVPRSDEDRYLRTLDSLLEGCQIIGYDWRYLYINDVAASHGHRAKDELIGHTMMECYPGIEKTHVFSVLERCMQERTVENLENEFTYPDGTTAWFELRAEPVPEGIFILSVDITKRKRDDQQIRKLHRTLNVLSDINQSIVRIRHMPTLYDKACEIATEKGTFRMAWIGLLDPQSKRVNAVAHAGVSDGYLNNLNIFVTGDPVEHGPTVRALYTGEPVIYNNIETDARLLPQRAQALQLGYRALAALPLTVAGEVRGTLNLYADEPDFFDAEELRLLNEMAGDIAFATEMAEQEEQRQRVEGFLKRYAQRLEILHQIDLGIINGSSIQALVETTLKNIRQIIPYRRADVTLLEEEAGEALIFAVDFEGDTKLGPGVRVPKPANVLEGYDDRHLRLFDDIRLFQDTRPRSRQLVNEGLLCALSALLMDREHPMGTLGLFSDTPGFFTAEHQDIVVEVASQLTIAIRQLRLSEALSHSESRYRSVVEDQTELICRYDTDFNLTFVNRAYGEAYGLRPQEMLGMNILERIPSEDRERAVAHIKSLTASNPVANSEHRSILPDQTVHWLQWTDRALPNEAGEIVEYQGVGRDITERKLAEEAVREQRRIAEAMRDSLAALTASLDVDIVMAKILEYAAHVVPYDTAAITQFKEGMTRLVFGRGFSTEYHDFLKNFSTPVVTSKQFVLIQDNKPYLIADTQLDPDWNRFSEMSATRSSIGVPIVIQGKVYGALSVDSSLPGRYTQLDVEHLQVFARYAGLALNNAYHASRLEQKVAERTAELDRAKARVEAIVNNSTDGMLLLYVDGGIQQANVAFNKLFACEVDDFFGKPLNGLVEAEDIDLVAHAVESVVVDRRGKTIAIRARRKDGTLFDAELGIGFVHRQDEDVQSLVCTIRDITERKAQDRQLRYYASLQENVTDAVVSTDLNYHIRSWNKAAERMYGWRAEEVIGKSSNDILRTEFLTEPTRAEAVRKLMEQGYLTADAIQPHKDGRAVYVLASIVVLRDENGRPLGFVSINHDITERRKTDEALRESEARFRNFFEQPLIGMAMTSPEKGMMMVNDKVCEILGYSRAELLQLAWPEISHPDDLAVDVEQFNQVLAGAIDGYSMEKRYIGKDGRTIPVFMTVRCLRDSQGKIMYFMALVQDITERKRAEAALSARMEEERTFQRYLKALHEITIELTQIDELDMFYRRTVELGRERLELERLALFLHDAGDGIAQGTYGTDAQGRLTDERQVRFGIDPKGVMARALGRVERFYIDKQVPLFDGLKSVGFGWNAATILWNGSQSLGWLVADNLLHHEPASKPLLDILGLYALSVGALLAQKQAQIALRESEARYRLLAENITDMVTRVDKMGYYIYVSPSSRTLLGYEPEELAGQYGYDLIHPDDVQPLLSVQMSAMDPNTPTAPLTYRQRHKEGHYVWVETNGRLILSEDKTDLLGFITVTRDVSERKRAEEALHQALDKERELGELKSRFISMASHEFRTPLATILAVTETLDAYRHKLSDEQIKERLGKIQTQVGHLKDIMEDVLQLARLQARRADFRPVRLDLDSLCTSVLDEYRSRPDVTHELVYSCEAALHEVTLDRKLMRQLIDNLVSNAIKYSPEHKTIFITLEYVDEKLVLKVRDQGIGIPENDLKYLFEPFHRAENVGTISGTGLGLAIARESVELHGGTIAVESHLSVGTTIVVNIPLSRTGGLHDKDTGH